VPFGGNDKAGAVERPKKLQEESAAGLFQNIFQFSRLFFSLSLGIRSLHGLSGKSRQKTAGIPDNRTGKSRSPPVKNIVPKKDNRG
jgi:hypothetical protein